MDEWDDLRYFLSVADTGSTLAAGRELRVSQTTAARRVAGLEARLGLRLFDRRQAGYQLTADGAALLNVARGVATATDAFADAAAARVRASAGTIRLTASEMHAVTILAPIVRDFHLAHPELRIDLDTTDAVRDLDAGAADVAVRVATQPSGNGLVGRRVCDDPWTVYCSADYARTHGAPRHPEQLRGHPIIGGGEPGVWRYYRQWLAMYDLERSVIMHHNTSLGLFAAVRSGLGLAALPSIIADHEPDLVRCTRAGPEERGMWVVIHERSRRIPHIRAAADFIYDRLRALDAKRASGQLETMPT